MTLATGNEQYNQLASNLLKSYRYRNGKYPFALLSDRKTRYNSKFDSVILLQNTIGSYIDKFRILIDSPFEETIFIEPDCLVYQNIDCFWEYFSNATDFSSFGWNNSRLDFFLNTEDIKKDWNIELAPVFCPGYLFVRKSPISQSMYKDCLLISDYLIKNKERHPNAFAGGMLRDDPVFFLAMKLNECACIAEPSIGKCIHYPSFKKRNGHYPIMNFSQGYLEDDIMGSWASLCHFSYKYTWYGKYRQQVAAMNCYMNKNIIIGKLIEKNLFNSFFNIYGKIASVIHRYLY